MVSAVLSDNSSPAPMKKLRSRDHGVYVGECEGEGKKRKNAKLFFKWLISFLSDTEENFNDETC